MKPPGPRLSPVGEGTRITYESLIRRHTAHLRARGRTPGGIRNALSALSGFRASAADQADELVGPEMGPFFRDRLNRYVSRLGAASSRGNARSLMNGWRREFLEMQAQAGLPQDFAGALTALFRSSGISVRKAAAAIRSRRTTLLSWMAGASWPNLRQEPKVAALEHVLGAPWGALTARLRPVRRRALEPGRTPYREKLIALKQKPYSFRPRDWPERLGEEFTHLVSFKSSPFLEEGIRRNMAWTLRDGECPTAGMVREVVARFYGWLLLPASADDPQLRGKGLRVDDLSLALLTDPGMDRGFLEFLKTRSGGYTNQSLWFLEWIYSLTKEDTGYFPQHPRYADHPLIAAQLPAEELFRGRLVPLETRDERWSAWCRRTAAIVLSHRGSLRPYVHKGRDPTEAIRQILDLPRPLEALFQMLDGMRAAMPPATMDPVRRAVAKRDLLLVEMLASNPLRVGMFSTMTCRDDGTGNLYRGPDGSWNLRYPSGAFKNRAGAARAPYDVAVSERLWPMIDEYLRSHRPHLMGASDCDYVFRPNPRRASPGSKLPDPRAPMRPGSLSNIVRIASQMHLPEGLGFSAHHIRHIIATHLIKVDPDKGWARAAYALHDQEETIHRAYGHLRVSETHGYWLDAYEECRSDHEAVPGAFREEYDSMLPLLRGAVARGETDLRHFLAEIEARSEAQRNVA